MSLPCLFLQSNDVLKLFALKLTSPSTKERIQVTEDVIKCVEEKGLWKCCMFFILVKFIKVKIQKNLACTWNNFHLM